MLHASSNPGSNTVWMGRQTLARLPEAISTREILLQNGTIQDCRGCSYEACRHFAEGGRCFYGGAVTEQVLPAVQQADAVLALGAQYGWQNASCRRDYSGNDRAILLQKPPVLG